MLSVDGDADAAVKIRIWIVWNKFSQLVPLLTTHTHKQPFYGSVEFVRDNPGEPVPEETFTHSHSSWSSTFQDSQNSFSMTFQDKFRPKRAHIKSVISVGRTLQYT